MQMPAAGVRTIGFDVQEGELVLRGDPHATSVSMRVSIDRLWIFRLGRKESSNDPSRSLGEGTGELKIVTDIPRSIASWGRAEYPIDFEVGLPAGIPLQVRDTSGSIRISPLNAPVEVHDGSGTLMISDVHGVVTVVKDSGDIQVEPVSDVTRITSKTGQMRLHDLARLEIEESDGSLEIVTTGPGHIRADSSIARRWCRD